MFEFFKREKDKRTKKEKILDEIKKLERELTIINQEEDKLTDKILKKEKERKDYERMEAIFDIQANFSPDKAQRIINHIKKDLESAQNGKENIFNMNYSYAAKKNGFIDDFF